MESTSSLDPRWFSVIGLAFDLVGAMVLAWGLFVSRQKAKDLSAPKWGENPMLYLEYVRNSRRAVLGVGMLGFGFVLQIIGTWPRP